MMPSHEGLMGNGDLRRQVDDRLIVEGHFGVEVGVAERRLRQQTLRGTLAECLVEHLDPPASSLLRLVHRNVCVAEEHDRIVAGSGDRDPDTHGDASCDPVEIDRLIERRPDALADRHQRIHTFDTVDENDELVPAQSSNDVTISNRGLESPSHGNQQLVSNGVAECVVDVLEAVQIEKQESDHVIGVVLERDGEPINDQRPIRQPGQLIVAGTMFQEFLRTLRTGDVPRVDHEPVAGCCGLRHPHDQLEPPPCRVRLPEAGLDRLGSRGMREPSHCLLQFDDIVRMEPVPQRRGRATEVVVRIQSEDFAERPADVRNADRCVHDDDRVEGMLHERTELFSSFHDGRLGQGEIIDRPPARTRSSASE